MAKLDDEIDRLYQLPLSEFTKARDDLAQRFDKDRGSIKQLQKPSAAAWAVNQLYWRERGKYEALVAAASKVRAAQLASLKGKPADAAAAEKRHASTRRTALDRIREMLTRSGEALSPGTWQAINETLDALPTDDQQGRLVRPLKPMGFQGLAGMLKGIGISLRRAEVVPFKNKPTPEQEEDRQADLRKEIQKLTASLRDAKDAERVAASAQSRAHKALEAAKRARQSAVDALDAATDQLGAATRDLADRERLVVAAVARREGLEQQLQGKKKDDGR